MGKIVGLDPDDFIDAAHGKNVEEIKSQMLEQDKRFSKSTIFGQDVLKKGELKLIILQVL